MKIADKFLIKFRGLVASGRLTTNGPKAGDTARRVSDGATWLITGVEWFAMMRRDDPHGNGTTRPGAGDSVGLLLTGETAFNIGDELVFEYKNPFGASSPKP